MLPEDAAELADEPDRARRRERADQPSRASGGPCRRRGAGCRRPGSRAGSGTTSTGTPNASASAWSGPSANRTSRRSAVGRRSRSPTDRGEQHALGPADDADRVQEGDPHRTLRRSGPVIRPRDRLGVGRPGEPRRPRSAARRAAGRRRGRSAPSSPPRPTRPRRRPGRTPPPGRRPRATPGCRWPPPPPRTPAPRPPAGRTPPPRSAPAPPRPPVHRRQFRPRQVRERGPIASASPSRAIRSRWSADHSPPTFTSRRSGSRRPHRRDHLEQHVDALARDAAADVQHPRPAGHGFEPRRLRPRPRRR